MDRDSQVRLEESLTHLRSLVGGPVVHDDDLDPPVCLLVDTLERLVQVVGIAPACVINRNDHRDERTGQSFCRLNPRQGGDVRAIVELDGTALR